MTTQTNRPARNQSNPTFEDFGPLIILMIIVAPLGLLGIFGTFVWEDHREAQKTQTIELLPGAAEGYLSKYSSPTSLSRSEFLALVGGERITMSVYETGVVYEVVVNGDHFRYFQYEDTGMHYSVLGEEHEIREGFLTRTLVRNKFWWLW